jgi:tRNA modification GTPase
VRGYNPTDTIAALATPGGVGAIGVLRLSGTQTFGILNNIFTVKNLAEKPSHTLHFGKIKDGDTILDEVLVSIFKNPNSYTGEDVAEISCHGSPFILQKVLELLVNSGARLAQPGEFTLRAFLNKKLDLSQAEAVADLINADSEAALKTAMNQMRGGYSEKIRMLRERLVNFASLIELELDFAEEDVEFANRPQLKALVYEILGVVNGLKQSFKLGNVIKNGIPTVIAGKPNAGKSTLLNALLNEERAIVSDIAGTTRDTIEEAMQINGIVFRFIDTAGIRTHSDSEIENIGIGRTHEKIKTAALVIYLFDVNTTTPQDLATELEVLKDFSGKLLLVGNKAEGNNPQQLQQQYQGLGDVVLISSKEKNITALLAALETFANTHTHTADQTIITNLRHYEALQHTAAALEAVVNGLDSGITGELLAFDIRRSLHHLGEIVGDITTDDLLANIFSKFCIGK